MAYDVGAVRGQYPALADGRAWLDGAAGTQVPQAVAAAFRVAGHPPAAIAGHLDRRGVNCWHGYAYAHELAGALGSGRTGAWSGPA